MWKEEESRCVTFQQPSDVNIRELVGDSIRKWVWVNSIHFMGCVMNKLITTKLPMSEIYHVKTKSRDVFGQSSPLNVKSMGVVYIFYEQFDKNLFTLRCPHFCCQLFIH